MKYSYSAFALLALSGMVQATIPTCAQSCIAASVAKVTTCGADDLACQCSSTNEAAIQSDATTCVLADCGATEALAVLSAAQADCSSVLATASTAASTSSTPATTSSSVATTSVASSTQATASSTAVSSSVASSTLATVSSSASSAKTTAAATTSSASKNSTVTTSSTPVQVTNGAAQYMAGAGSLAMAGFAVLAAL
ncbi:hypothetical protein BDZ45DRAFT_232325 [Acephala macrosclerotiorum]|nr:hypothetical protein BDZ45DRAFT_232325 [Acephala macrosclerotiorum]